MKKLFSQNLRIELIKVLGSFYLFLKIFLRLIKNDINISIFVQF